MNYNPRYAEITYSSPFVQDAHEENPESILDDHVQRVMKTPISESPGTGRHSPKSRSPDGLSGVRGVAQSGQGKHSARHDLKGETSHPYNHKYVPHSHASIVEPEGAPPSHGSSAWSLETSYYGSKSRSYADGMVSNPVEHRCGTMLTTDSLHLQNIVFTYQLQFLHYAAAKVALSLEEVCRRLEEEKIKSGALQPKQRYVMEVIQRGRAAVRPAPVPLLNMVPAVSDSELSEPEYVHCVPELPS
ncbi:hypothetical protein XENOCAPTIV_008807 [Xenoophorus captivus]|uniref:Axin beta-catenin binding domain-containing protein n=1 Tax=Xenoophorus captivus TaxID=1517983 RepID=A0ABV0RPK8_9TELE